MTCQRSEPQEEAGHFLPEDYLFSLEIKGTLLVGAVTVDVFVEAGFLDPRSCNGTGLAERGGARASWVKARARSQPASALRNRRIPRPRGGGLVLDTQ